MARECHLAILRGVIRRRWHADNWTLLVGHGMHVIETGSSYDDCVSVGSAASAAVRNRALTCRINQAIRGR